MTQLSQLQKEKAADIILDFTRTSGGPKALDDTIDKLDLIINPQVSTPTGSRNIRQNIAKLITEYTSGVGRLTLEKTIEEIANALQNSSFYPKKTINLLNNLNQKQPTPTLHGRSFTKKQTDVLKQKSIYNIDDFTIVLESVIDKNCIHMVDFYVDSQGHSRYHAEFMDTGKNMILFQFTATAVRGAELSPTHIILSVLKSFHDSYYASCQGVLFYNHFTGMIEPL